jgi:glycosyltransferase involved in cell wall biosynthesis
MKIAIVVDEIAPGGMAKILAYPITYLKRKRHEVKLIAIIKKNYGEKNNFFFKKLLYGNKITYLFNTFPKIFKLLNFKFPFMSFFSLHHILCIFFSSRSIDLNNFDIIFSHSQYTAFASRNLKKKFNIPYSLILWDPSTFTAKKIYKKKFGIFYPLLKILSKLLDNYAISKCNNIITSGKFHHKYLKKKYKKKLDILIPGCFPKKKINDFSKREKIIVAWDRWDIGNNPIKYLRILKKLQQNDIKLEIAGFWHPKNIKIEFEKEIEKLNLKNRVKMYGLINDKQIAKLCSRAYLHLHLIHEAFGMQVLEAAANGCPSMIPYNSGSAELFKNNISGLHPKNTSTENFVKEIDFFFNNPKLANKISYNCWRISKEYTWDNYARNLEELAKRNKKSKTI